MLALTRQNLPALRLKNEKGNLCKQGAYELSPASGDAKVSLFASGSEVSLCVEAQKQLEKNGVPTRVVSVPCMDLFFDQPESVRERVIGTAPVKIACEAAIRMGWDEIVGSDGKFVGMTGFGASAPYKDLYKRFVITVEAIVEAATKALPSQAAAKKSAAN